MDKRNEGRHAVEMQGRYRVGTGVSRDVVVADLSRHGCKFFDRYSNLSDGDRVSLRVGSIGPIEANVIWREGGYVGVRFCHPLHPAVLDHMVVTMDMWTPVDRP